MYLEVAQGFGAPVATDTVWHQASSAAVLVQVGQGVDWFIVQVMSGRSLVVFKHVNGGLNIWISWVNNLLSVGEAKVNEKEKEEFKKKFDCVDVGKLIEFVGVKIVIDWANWTAKLMQPVLLQTFGDEFEIRSSHVDILATAGHIISYKHEDAVYLNPKQQCVF
jgi:hypothetical protein